MTWRVCWLTIWTEARETGAPVVLSVTVPSNAPVTVSWAIAKRVVWPNQAITSSARSSNLGECDCRVKRITNLCDGDRISIGRITARLLCSVSSSFTTGPELKDFAKARLSLNYPADVNLEDTDTEKGKKSVSREER